jgi:NAD-dependent SIR2 family protein deacetylase
MTSVYEKVAGLMVDLKRCVALTGAGLSNILEEVRRMNV